MSFTEGGLLLSKSSDGSDLVASITYHSSGLGTLKKLPNWKPLQRTLPALASYPQVAFHTLLVDEDPANEAFKLQASRRVAAVVFVYWDDSPPVDLASSGSSIAGTATGTTPKIKIPVVVVTKTDGQRIGELLGQAEALYAEIDVEGNKQPALATAAAAQPDLEKDTQDASAAACVDPDAPKALKVNAASSSSGGLFGGLVSSGKEQKQAFPLSSRITRLFLVDPDKKGSASNLVNMSSDAERFRQVFQTFDEFERYCEDGLPEKLSKSVEKTCQNLKEYLRVTDLDDLPFHMLASFRMRWVPPYYKESKKESKKEKKKDPVMDYFNSCWKAVVKIDHTCIRNCFRPFFELAATLEIPWGNYGNVPVLDRFASSLLYMHSKEVSRKLSSLDDVQRELCICQMMLGIDKKRTAGEAQSIWKQLILAINTQKLPWSESVQQLFHEQLNLANSWQVAHSHQFDASLLGSLVTHYELVNIRQILCVVMGVFPLLAPRDDVVHQLLRKLYPLFSEALAGQTSLEMFTSENTISSFLTNAKDLLGFLLNARTNRVQLQKKRARDEMKSAIRDQQAAAAAADKQSASAPSLSENSLQSTSASSLSDQAPPSASEASADMSAATSVVTTATATDPTVSVVPGVIVGALSLAAKELIAEEDKMFAKWISAVVKSRFLVMALPDVQFPDYIAEFVSEMSQPLAGMATSEISTFVAHRAGSLSPECLRPLLEKFNWLGPEVGVAFLKSYRLPKDRGFDSPALWRLLALFAKRWSTLKAHILELLKSIAFAYVQRDQASRVLNELLHMAGHVPMLLSDEGVEEVVDLASDSDDSDAEDDSLGSSSTASSALDSLGSRSDATPVADSLTSVKSKGHALLEDLTKFLAQDIVIAQDLAETLRISLPTVLEYIDEAREENPLCDAVLDALVMTLPPKTKLFLDWQGISDQNLVKAADSAQQFVGTLYSLLNKHTNLSTAVSSQQHGKPLQCIRFLWKLACGCASEISVEKLNIARLPKLQAFSMIHLRLSNDEQCPKEFREWFAELKQWAQNLNKSIVEDEVRQDHLQLCIDMWRPLSGFYKNVGLDSLLSEVEVKDKLTTLETTEDAVDHLLVWRPKGSTPEKLYLTKQLLNKYGVAIDSKIETAISQNVVLPDCHGKAYHRARSRRDRPGSAPRAQASQAVATRAAAGDSRETINKARFIPSTTLQEAKELLDVISDWLVPVVENLDVLVFFHHRNSRLFSAFLQKELNSVVLKRSAVGAGDVEATTPDSQLSSLFSNADIYSSSRSSGSPESDASNTSHDPNDGFSLEEFASALRATQDWLHRFVTNKAKLSDMYIITQDIFHAVSVQQEFDALVEFEPFQIANRLEQGSSSGGSDVLANVRSMLELLNYSGILMTIVNVCHQYQLEGCLTDPQFRQVHSFAKQLSEGSFFEELDSGRASQVKTELDTLLCGTRPENLQIFAAIQDCVDFGKIICEHKFDRPQGKAKFESQVKLIMHQIENEEYNDIVLNHLTASFVYMLPFVDKSSTFAVLLRKVKSWQPDIIQHAIHQLRTVHDNMEMIKFWFSRAQGETLENVIYELDDILSSGKYCFVFGAPAAEELPFSEDMADDQKSAILSNPSVVHIIYRIGSARPVPDTPSTALQSINSQTDTSSGGDTGYRYVSPIQSLPGLVLPRNQAATVASSNADHNAAAAAAAMPAVPDDLRRVMERLGGSVERSSPSSSSVGGPVAARPRVSVRVLSAEDIDDFVRRLGFVESGSNIEHQPKIKKFVARNQAIREDFSLCQKLAALGHQRFLDRLKCVSVKEANDDWLGSTRLTLSKWSEKVAEYREKYPLLVFFSVQQTVAMSRLLHSENAHYCFAGLIHYIGQLYLNTLPTWQTLNSAVTTLSNRMSQGSLGSRLQNAPPIEVVGDFLKRLSNAIGGDQGALSLLPGKTSAMSADSPLHQEHRCILHVTSPSTPAEMLRLLLSIFMAIPHSFQVLRCQSSTTEEQLSLFLRKAFLYTDGTFVLFEVNKLSSALQEYLLSTQLEYHTAHTNAVARNRQPTRRAQLHCLESGKSMLQDVPWVRTVRYQSDQKVLSDPACFDVCAVNKTDIKNVHVVYGDAGSGKSHFIKSHIKQHNCSESLTIAVNEAFTATAAIKKLRALPRVELASIYFNITVISQPKATREEQAAYASLLAEFHWVLLGLIGFHCVEDHASGTLFRVPGGLAWRIYVEVPSQLSSDNTGSDLQSFLHHVPLLRFVGERHYVSAEFPYDLEVDKEFQVVAKYLNAHKDGSIDRTHRDYGRASEARTIASGPNISEQQCQMLLRRFTPAHLRERKILQRLFVRYMLRRCLVLENMPAYTYNTGRGVRDESGSCSDTSELGSTLMRAMLKETQQFCNPQLSTQFESHSHEQLVYEMKSGCHTVQLLSTQPYKISEEDRVRYAAIGVSIPEELKFGDRAVLDSYLSCALNVPLENGRLAAIDEENYVLTLDYTVKMLAIHERRMCGVPVVIEGETGVGKTALLHMLSLLWNRSAQSCRKMMIKDLGDILVARLSEPSASDMEPTRVTEMLNFVHDFNKGMMVTREQIVDYFMKGRTDSMPTDCKPILEVLADLRSPRSCLLQVDQDLVEHVLSHGSSSAPEKLVALLKNFFTAPTIKTFHKVKIHSALTATHLKKRLRSIFEEAQALSQAMHNRITQEREWLKVHRPHAVVEKHETPVFTVFMDEVNTTSCMGLFKELLVDKTLDGEPVPDNVFLVAACNPHRSSSVGVSSYMSHRDWMAGSYQVRAIPPSLRCLSWSYGALSGNQEKEYIESKIANIGSTKVDMSVQLLSTLILTSQRIMRDFAEKQLTLNKFDPSEAKLRATSCVSQRDIQRVFTLSAFFDRSLRKDRDHLVSSRTTLPSAAGTPVGRSRFFSILGNWSVAERNISSSSKSGKAQLPSREALLLALGLVYYLRLDTSYRCLFVQRLTAQEPLGCGDPFLTIFNREMDKYMSCLSVPAGIAKTQALKENIFATIVCCVVRMPLIIVGAPGSSKTLSFNLAVENLKGLESPKEFFRDTSRFPALDPQFYQCSRKSTSLEIENVFLRTINRQKSHQKNRLDRSCVVFMDEAGLPEDCHESLKALHYFLDNPEVSFVAITNRVLDAAKTNRAISLFRPDPDESDLCTLAYGCMCSDPEHPPPYMQSTKKMLDNFCGVYRRLMQDERYSSFFGLRDFIHFIHYLRRGVLKDQEITPQIVLRGLERNFNGILEKDFKDLAHRFLAAMDVSKERLQEIEQRSVVEILAESIEDNPMAQFQQRHRFADDSSVDELQDSLACDQDQVRYKLIIDESEDDSMTRLLFHYKILDEARTRCFTCSDFTGDSELQQINLVSSIRHAALEGSTAVLSESDAINESFYDLFNQRFRQIADSKGVRYFANIAIGSHSKLSRVDPSFQCVVHVRAAELHLAPLPFLNRFEKYRLSQRNLLDVVLKSLPHSMKEVIMLAMDKVEKFVEFIGENNFTSFNSETIVSLFIDFLPLPGHKLYTRQYDVIGEDDEEEESDYEPMEAASLTRGDAREPHDMQKAKMIVFNMFENIMRAEAGFRFVDLPTTHKEQMFGELLQQAFDLEPLMSKSLLESDLRYPKRFREYVLGALDHLYTTSPEGVYTGNDSGECANFHNGQRFVTAIILQWIVMRMTSRLLQLLRPEVLVLKRSVLPDWVMDTYLQQQSHFDLKALLASKVEMLDNSTDSNSVNNKLLIFTQTKPQLHRIAHSWPVDDVSTVPADTITALKELVCEDLDQIVLGKLDHIHTEEQMKTMLQRFIRSETHQVLVFMADTANCSRQRINHLRLSIEDEERSNATSLSRAIIQERNAPCKTKLFVVLLHSAAERLHGPSSYPALFLLGWDHHYLEVISHGTSPGAVNVHKLMRLTCLSNPPVGLAENFASLVRYSIAEQLPAALRVVVSRIMFGSCPGGWFNGEVNARRRFKLLTEIMSPVHPLSSVVCKRIAQYWSDQAVLDHFHATATLTHQQSDSFSLTEQLEDVFSLVVQNVLTLLISKLNEHFNFEVLARLMASKSTERSVSPPAHDGSSHREAAVDTEMGAAVMDLFCAVTDALPLPNYSSIKAMNHMPDLRMPRHLAPPPPTFPFFQRVWSANAQILQQVITDEHGKPAAPAQNANAAGGSEQEQLFSSSSDSQQQLEERAAAAMFDRLHELERCGTVTDRTPLIAYQLMARYPCLWQLYLNDFIRQRLRISSSSAKARGQSPGHRPGADFEHLLVSVFLEGLTVQPVEKRLILLHVLSHFRLPALSKLSQSLRPLAALDGLLDESSEQLAVSDRATQQLEARLTLFLVTSLHTGLVSSFRDRPEASVGVDNLSRWHSAYMSVLQSMPHLLYTPLLQGKHRAKLNICAVISALLNIIHLSVENISAVIHLVMALQVALDRNTTADTVYLSITDAVYHALATLYELNSQDFEDVHTSENGNVTSSGRQQFRRSGALLIQLLLQHYFPTLPKSFSMHTSIYCEADCLWLLKSIHSNSAILLSDEGWSLVNQPTPATHLASVQSDGNENVHVLNAVRSCCEELFTASMAEYWTQQLLLVVQRDEGAYEKLRANIEAVLCHNRRNAATCFIPCFYDQPYIRQSYPDLAVNSSLLAESYFTCCLFERMSSLQGMELLHVAALLRRLETPSSCVEAIEYQATLQVLLFKLADRMGDYALGCDADQREGLRLHFPHDLVNLVNNWVLDQATGGGKKGGHSYVLLSRLLRKLHSSERLVKLLTGDQLQTLVLAFNPFLKPFVDELEHPLVINCHLMPFAYPSTSESSDLGKIYRSLVRYSRDIIERSAEFRGREEQESIGMFVATLRGPLADAVSDEEETLRCQLRMVLWYCVYHCFYLHRHTSTSLTAAIHEDLGFLELQPCQVALLLAFLDPIRLIQRAEVMNPANADAVRLQLGPSGSIHRRRDPSDQEVDSLWQVFDPRLPLDSEDAQLRNALANLIAGVMGMPADSSHLWAHMFNPASLAGTFLTGNMYPNKVSANGLQYDCGCELNADGEYGRSDYTTHCTRGNLTLPSRYLLLWANYGAFCVSLLTQDGAYDGLRGPVISEWQSVRHYCISQVRTAWLLMRTNLNLNDEERSFFVVQAMANLQKNGQRLFGQSTFTNLESLNRAEASWHSGVYESSIAACQNPTMVNDAVWQNHPLLLKLRDFENVYPSRVSSKHFYHAVEQHQHSVASRSSTQWHTLPAGIRLARTDILQHMMVWRRRLHVGGMLLPDLVEFYTWIHSMLAFSVTFEQATTVTVGQVLERLSQRYSKSAAQHINQLFERLSGRFNAYVDFCGGVIGHGGCATVSRENKLHQLSASTVLLSLLSESTEEGQGNDTLFVVLRQVVETHNQFLDILSTLLPSTDGSLSRTNSYDQLMSLYARLRNDLDSNTMIQPQEVSSQTCLLGDVTVLEMEECSIRNTGSNVLVEDQLEFLRVIRRHFTSHATSLMSSNSAANALQSLTSSVFMSRSSDSSSSNESAFDLHSIEQDLLLTYAMGRARIADPASMRIVFKFKDVAATSVPTAQPHPTQQPTPAVDISKVDSQLPTGFSKDLSSEALQTLKLLSHNLDSVVTGECLTMLLTILGHVRQAVLQYSHPLALQGGDDDDGCDNAQVASRVTEPSTRLLQFLTPLLCPAGLSGSVLSELVKQLAAQRVPDRMVEHIFSLPLSSIVGCIHFFRSHLLSGECQYAHLAMRLKTPLRPELAETLMAAIPAAYDNPTECVQGISSLLSVLSGVEAHLGQQHDVCVRHYLISNHFYSEHELPIALFPPDQVCIEHYVALRLLLTRLKDDINARIVSSSPPSSSQGASSSRSAPPPSHWPQSIESWTPVVAELWNKLPGWHDDELGKLDAPTGFALPLFHLEGGTIRALYGNDDSDGDATPVLEQSLGEDDWLDMAPASRRQDNKDKLFPDISTPVDSDADASVAILSRGLTGFDDSDDDEEEEDTDDGGSETGSVSESSSYSPDFVRSPSSQSSGSGDPGNMESFCIVDHDSMSLTSGDNIGPPGSVSSDDREAVTPMNPTADTSHLLEGVATARPTSSPIQISAGERQMASGNLLLPSPSTASPASALSPSMLKTLQNEELLTMSVEDVANWLRKINMEDLVELFVKNDIDGGMLSQMDDSLLEDLQVNTVLKRRRILSELSKLRKRISDLSMTKLTLLQDQSSLKLV
eukprot:scpid215/ scgid3933/ E3 ubiquitin-protein ligase RNF213